MNEDEKIKDEINVPTGLIPLLILIAGGIMLMLFMWATIEMFKPKPRPHPDYLNYINKNQQPLTN